MTLKNKKLEKKCEELQKQLEETKKEAEYYQLIAEDVGKKCLRETDQLLQFIEKQEETRETDELTGLNNRKGFITLAEQQLKIAKRNKREFSLLFADLDNLKWINDTFGHKEGDIALIANANIIKECFRESDIKARLGGDEFTVFIVDCNKQISNVLNMRLQEKIEEFNKSGMLRYHLSLSAGLAYYDPEHHRSLNDLIDNADQLMFKHKRSKKNIDSTGII